MNPSVTTQHAVILARAWSETSARDGTQVSNQLFDLPSMAIGFPYCVKQRVDFRLSD